jgi:hypothetical protein
LHLPDEQVTMMGFISWLEYPARRRGIVCGWCRLPVPPPLTWNQHWRYVTTNVLIFDSVALCSAFVALETAGVARRARGGFGGWLCITRLRRFPRLRYYASNAAPVVLLLRVRRNATRINA